MRKSIFNDSVPKGRKKTRRWLGWVTFCSLLLVGQIGFAFLVSNLKSNVSGNVETFTESIESNNNTLSTSSESSVEDVDDEPLYCSQISESSGTGTSWALGGSTNQSLAADFIVFEGTTFNIQQVKVNVTGTATYFNVIFFADNGGVPGPVVSSFSNVPIIGSIPNGGITQHTLDLSAEDVSFSSSTGDIKYWMQIQSDASGWENRVGSQIGGKDAYLNDTTEGWTIINADGGNNDLVYELIGECIGSCLPPTAPTATYTDATNVVLSWLGEGTLFDVEWGLAGFTIGSGTQINDIATNSINITVLPQTPYEFYVRQDCGENGVSSWIGPFAFQTEYCTPGYLYGCSNGAKITNFTTSDAILNVDNVTGAATCGTDGYNNFTAMSVAAPEDMTISFTVGIGSYSAGVKIWIDWNGNGVFEASELMSESAGTIASGGTYTGSFTVPVGTPLGDYRIRVRAVESTTIFDACSQQNYGETEDYTFTVIDPPACMPPSGVAVTLLGVESVGIEWQSTGTSFEIEYGLEGFTQGSGTMVTTSGTSYTFTGLTETTTYTYYIRQDCAADGYSLWTGPYSFTTATPGQIGNGSTTSNYFPIYTFYGYNYSQQIYYASELLGSLDEDAYFITKIGFKPVTIPGSPTSWDNWTVYMGNTDKTSFENTTDWVPFSELEEVFSGTVTFTEGEWMEINLDTPFVWDGVSNLAVAVDENTPGYSGTTAWASFNGGANRGILYYSDGTNPDPENPPAANYAPNSNIAQIKIDAIELPTCMPAIGLSADNVTYTSADLSWESSGSVFEIEYGESGFTLGTGTVITNVTGTSITIENLNPETLYQFYVRQDCTSDNDGYSIWSAPRSFYTGYCLAYSSNTSTAYRITGFSTSEGYTNISNLNNGIADSYNNYSNFAVTQSEGGSFDYAVDVPGYTNVEIWIDYNNNMVFDTDELVAAHEYLTVATTFTGTIDLPATIDEGDYRIRVRSRYYWNTVASPCGDLQGETEDYTLSIVPVPACMPPSGLTATPTSLTDVTLGWTSIGNSFEVEWGPAGFALGTGTQISGITTNSTDVEVIIDTPYQFYVRQDCDTDGYSLWSGPFSFQTGYCTPGYLYGCSNGAKITNFTTSDAILNVDNVTGATTCGTDGYNNFTAMSVAAPEDMTISFTVGIGSYSAGVKIWIDWNGNGVFEASELISESAGTIASGGTYTGSFTVPVGTPLGDYRIRVRAVESTTIFDACSQQNYGETEDYTFTVITPPTCMPPTGLDNEQLSLTSTVLSWVSDGTLFDVEYGLQGFELGTGTSVTGLTTTSTTISDLIADTWYQFYVRQDCGEEDGVSLWAGPYKFYTGYCLAQSTNTGDYISSFITTGGIPFDISNITSSGSANGYGNYTSMSVHHYQTGSVNFTITTNSSMGINIWVDWNNNLEFEESEKVYASGATGTTFTGTITVPFGVPEGDYRMRVRGQWNNTNPAPCGDITWGETEDYTFTVITPPSCLPAFQPTAVNISATSVSLSWQADGELFDIEYGPAGFTPGTGTMIYGVGNPYVLSGLESGVDYAYYVRQDCGEEDGVSTWNGPVVFTPGIYQGDIPSLLNANPQVEDDACATSFSIDVPEGYYLSGLNVQYIMMSWNTAFQSHQRSVLYSPTLNMGEPEVAAGTVDFPGMVTYNRDVDFANGATGTIEFQLKAWRTENGSGCSTDYVYVVDGSWILTPEFTLIPTCPEPTDLSYANPTLDSVDLMWTGEDGAMYDIQWGLPGFAPEDIEGTLITDLSSTSYTLSGLDSRIVYEFYVRRNCSSDDGSDYSAWIGPVKFNSGHCIPSSQYNHYISTFLTTNGEANISYYSTSINGSGYGDNTAMVVSDLAGESFNFSLNYVGGGSGLRIWVDWNSDYIFDSSEEVFYLANASGNKTGVINIPTDVLPGDYVMRVRVEFGASASPQACGHIEYGEALDFTLHVATVCEEVATPMGETTQTLTEGQTLADLVVGGANLTWYSDASLTEEVPATTEAVDGTTYYVTQTIDGCESEALAIYVEVTLSTDRFDEASFRAYPNPVRDILNISYSKDISEVAVINMLGQVVISEQVSATDAKVDMSGLPTGNYLVKVTVDGTVKTIKVMKQ